MEQIKLINTSSPEYREHFQSEFEKAVDGIREKKFFNAYDYYTVIRKKDVMEMLDCGTKLLDKYITEEGLPHTPGNPTKFIKGKIWEWMDENFTVSKRKRD